MNYLLSGKVFCKDCGRSMHGATRHYLKKDYTYHTYRCATPKRHCNNKEINQTLLEAYTMQLLEKHIFNAKAMKQIAKRVETHQRNSVQKSQGNRSRIERELEETKNSLQRVADAIADGLLSSALIERLNELEAKKRELEVLLSKTSHTYAATDIAIDPLLIPAQYAELRKTPNSPAYKTFIQSFIERIDVGRYRVTFTLKTGLGIYSELNLCIESRRQEIHQGEAV